jgi:hypothetical protein
MTNGRAAMRYPNVVAFSVLVEEASYSDGGHGVHKAADIMTNGKAAMRGICQSPSHSDGWLSVIQVGAAPGRGHGAVHGAALGRRSARSA